MMEQSISTATETACLSYRAHTHTHSLLRTVDPGSSRTPSSGSIRKDSLVVLICRVFVIREVGCFLR